jgi:high-affinity iron transporter
VAVLREGVETVIFLGAASFVSAGNNFLGALVGIALAVVLGYALFAASVKVNLKQFFNVTSILLILFAAGLVSLGLHELEEAGLVPALVEHVWSINPPVNPDGSYPLLHEQGLIGSLLHSLFGYSGDPALIQVLGWLAYLAPVLYLWRTGAKAQPDGGSAG